MHTFSRFSRSRFRLGLAGLVTLLLVGGLVLNFTLARSAHAAGRIFTVTDCSSANDPSSFPGLNLDLALSLAQMPGPLLATINFSCSGDIMLDQTLDITTTQPLTIDGSGQTVMLDGGGNLRVITVEEGASLSLNALTIANGSAGSDFGGAGLVNFGTVSISNSTFFHNSVDDQSRGGGLENADGTVSVTNSVFSDNSAGIGGGLDNGPLAGSVTITNSTFSDNVSNYILPADIVCGESCVGGGGLANASQSGTVSITNSTFSGNSTSSGATFPFGGGLANDAGTMSITNSTVSGNTAGVGDGIYNLLGTVSVANSTVSGNGMGSGTGLDNEDGTATVTFSTFSGSGLGLDNDNGTVGVGESIIAGNTSNGGCIGNFTDQGYNLFDSGLPRILCDFNASTDIQTSNPKIATTLANNGGPTQTLALLTGSPAIDQIPEASCPPTDQRGMTRPDNGEDACDIGAYEYVEVPAAITSAGSASTGMRVPFSFTVTATGNPTPSLSLSGALPTGLSFTDNGDGTATLGGEAAAGTSGTYNLTVTAANGVDASATQSFSLTVTTATSAPAITSSAADIETFGVPFSFLVTTDGYPAPTFSKTGTLPTGVTFTDNGDGTATLAGTPSALAAGVYSLTFKAKSTSGTATQGFTFTLVKTPVFKAVTIPVAHVGSAYSLTFKTSAYYTASLGWSLAAQPAGLSFVDNGDGTATISGTPQPGSGGAYAITVFAVNQLGTSTKVFTLKVNEAAAITSASAAAATVGQPFSFTVTTTGYPAPSLTKSGTLPKGLTYHAATHTIDGTPAAGSQGIYTLIFTAKNSTATVPQTFTLTVS